MTIFGRSFPQLCTFVFDAHDRTHQRELMKALDKTANEVVRAKLRRARRPCWSTRARWAVVPQEQIAKLAGISQAHLSNFENGKTDFDPYSLRALEKALVEISRRRTVDGFRLLADAV